MCTYMGGGCLRRPRTQFSSPRARLQSPSALCCFSSLPTQRPTPTSRLAPLPPSKKLQQKWLPVDALTVASATRLPTVRRQAPLHATTAAKRVTSLAIVPRRPRRKLATSAARRVTFPASAPRTRMPLLVGSAHSTAVVVTRAPSATVAVRSGTSPVRAPRHLEVLVGTAVGTAPSVAVSNVPATLVVA
ncbi:hypothetical protein C8Q79DRAFT_631449 [Trametes meyenii]|nr:hypothetical protein C8Q79DRAFT_631449 [Trametes meyenii]